MPKFKLTEEIPICNNSMIEQTPNGQNMLSQKLGSKKDKYSIKKCKHHSNFELCNTQLAQFSNSTKCHGAKKISKLKYLNMHHLPWKRTHQSLGIVIKQRLLTKLSNNKYTQNKIYKKNPQVIAFVLLTLFNIKKVTIFYHHNFMQCTMI